MAAGGLQTVLGGPASVADAYHTHSGIGGGVSDGDKGDVVVSGAGTVWTVDAGVVTLAKMANLAADSLIGRGNGGGAGVPQAITLGTNLSLAGTVLNAAGGGGAPTWTAVTVDLGAAKRSGTFDVTGLAGLTVAKFVDFRQSRKAIAAKGNATDEPEMDTIAVAASVLDAATIRANWICSNGAVCVGPYEFAYCVSA
jgi:hypothetical protein